MSRYASAALMLILAALGLTAFAQQSTTAQPDAQSAESRTVQTSSKPGTESNVVVARVSGEIITERQMLAAIQELSTRRIMMSPEQQKQRNTVLFKGAMDNLIIAALLKIEARKNNVTVDKAKVDQQMQQLAGRYPSREEFLKAVAGQGFTEAEVRESVEESLGMQEMINLATRDVPLPSEEEMQKFYESSPQLFAVPEQAHIAQIFIKVDPNSTLEQKADIRKKIEQIRTDIESKKTSFSDAAAKFSQDAASAPKGGDLGLIARTAMNKQLGEVIFGTAPGAMTPVIDDQGGYRLIQLVELRPAGTKRFEDSKPLIQQILTQAAKQKALQKYVEDLKAKADVQNFMTAEEFDRRHPAQ